VEFFGRVFRSLASLGSVLTVLTEEKFEKNLSFKNPRFFKFKKLCKSHGSLIRNISVAVVIVFVQNIPNRAFRTDRRNYLRKDHS
jgi:hypothetical protein